MIDYTKIKVHRFSKEQIEQKASQFRKQYWGEKSSPVNMLEILEFDLKIQVIPIPNLESICGTDCFITSNWQFLCIDQITYENESYDRRTNFSIAHEIGHFILHKDLWEGLKINDFQDFYTFIKDCPGEEYEIIEKQAHAFAARVLVPKEELLGEIKKLISKGVAPEKRIKYLQDRFNVSEGVIFKRIINEKIKIDDDSLNLI